jgi:cytochrome c553
MKLSTLSLVKYFTVLVALSVPVLSYASGDLPKPAKPDLVKGETSFTAVCAACHGADGNSGTPVNPKLAQQHPEYLVKQLQEFKSGKRNNAVMKGFATALSDEDMRNIAYWAASKKAKAGSAKDKELVGRFRRKNLPWWHQRPSNSCLRQLPQPYWCWYSSPIPAFERTARRLHDGSVELVPRRFT